MNCNLYKNGNFSHILNNFLANHNLLCAYDMMTSFNKELSYTRCNLKQQSFTLLDYFFISKELEQFVEKVDILNCIGNLSDHLPVELSLSVDVERNEISKARLPDLIDWNNVKGDIQKNYESVMDDCLSNIYVPDILHGHHTCNDPMHLARIEQYYCQIIDCIKTADLQLPRCKPTVRKSYWDSHLSLLKHNSIVVYNYWKLLNCPKSGLAFEAKKDAHYKYKLYLRKCQREHDQSRTDKLHENLINNDQHKFWKSFKHFNYSSSGFKGRINGFSNDADIANCFAESFRGIFTSNNANQSTKLKK